MGLIGFLSENRRWLGAGALLAFASSFGQTFFISVFAGRIQAEFGMSNTAWGSIYAIGTTTSAIVMVWAGGLTDRFRVHGLGTGVLLGLVLACLAMALVASPAMLLFVIFALRFTGQGMTSHTAIIAMARWFVGTRGKALSIAALGFAFGEALLPMTFVALMAFVDWRWLWVLAAALILAIIPVIRKLLQEERTPSALAKETESAGLDGRQWNRQDVLKQRLFWLYVPSVLGPSAFVTAMFFFQVHLAELKGWSHLQLAALFPVYTALAVLASIVSGIALDRLGAFRLLPFFQLPMALGFVLLGEADTLLWAAIAMGMIGLSVGANGTLPAAFWAEVFGTRHLGAIRAMATAIMVLGSAIGPALCGFLIDQGFGFDRQMLAIGAYFVVASALARIAVFGLGSRLA